MLQTIADAQTVHVGMGGELLASRMLETGFTLVVVYREASPRDGFITTAFLTSRPERLARRPQAWPPKT